MACPHLPYLGTLSPPKLSQSVHREECTQCFDNQDLDEGIDVCLTCFNGGCLGPDRHHAQTHFEKTSHNFSLNIRRKLRPSTKRTDEGEPPPKRLAILEEREEDKYEFNTTLRCWPCGGVEIEGISDSNPQVKQLSDAILGSMSSARQSEVKAWEEEILPCEHTLTLEQLSSGHIPASGLAHCIKCDLKTNLWLCLTCGNLGCGRPQYSGLGGNGHGLTHYEETMHPVSVKLGTITSEGTADIYCYTCNDSKLDPELVQHLSTFGINIMSQTKTEKTMTELQIEQNFNFEFSLTDDDGKAFEPLFGPGFTGLANLGNSCYMASVLQMIFSLDTFRLRYQPTAFEHSLTCTSPEPATCISCQMHKIADGLLSGRYSHPRHHLPEHSTHSPKPDEPLFQEGLRPIMFKSLIGKGHEEFSSMRQQDSEEFLSHLLKVLRVEAKKQGDDKAEEPMDVFRFGLEQRLQCSECLKVRYKVDEQDVVSIPVPAKELPRAMDGNPDAKIQYEPAQLGDCLEMVTGTEALEYSCPSCRKNVIVHKRSSFSTFPRILIIHAKKFQLVNWVPTKLDVPIILPPLDLLELDNLLGHGLQDNEVALPDDSATMVPSLPAFNEAAITQLQAMGFSLVRSQKALLATGNNSPEDAMEWLFEHMEDPDIDTPIQNVRSSSLAEPSSEKVALLTDMGFTPGQARKALRETAGATDRAVEWLFSHPDDMGDEPSVPDVPSVPTASHPGGSSVLPARYRLKAFISHKGPSVHSGHYVAHIRYNRQDGGFDWVLFNDEKVVKAGGESLETLKQLAYLYIFERI